MHRYLSILLFIGLAWGQIFDSKGISYGIGDTETGISLVGFNLSKNIDENYTIFFGVGSFIYVNPICIGIRDYKKTDNGKSSYSFFSIQYSISSSKGHFIPTFGLVSERILKDNSQKFKLGIMTFLAPNGVGIGPILRFEKTYNM
tara:strand:+ start:478 stop:912 length:435 start_codon:yes stop_codon:yes gene_type:complete